METAVICDGTLCCLLQYFGRVRRVGRETELTFKNVYIYIYILVLIL
jgi:hypothetical protein